MPPVIAPTLVNDQRSNPVSPGSLGPLPFRHFILGARLDSETAVHAVDTALAPWLPDA